MVVRAANIRLAIFWLALAWPIHGCTPSILSYAFLQYGKELRTVDLAKMALENPLGPEENFKLTTIGQGQGSSHHLVQIRGQESPHLHKMRDATVMMIRGRGYLVLGGKRVTLAAGDIAHIPRGVAHYYVNTDIEPTVVFVVFAPPFDEKDTIPAKLP
jgi:mannose-6-phosphate isomerase-like protein (cupin superfamily)